MCTRGPPRPNTPVTPSPCHVPVPFLYSSLGEGNNLQRKLSIDLVTVFDAFLTSRQKREKLQRLCENLILMSNNFRKAAVLKKI